MKLEDQRWRAHTEPSRFLHRAFSPWSKEKSPSPAQDRCVSASRLAVYATRTRQLWKRNSPTFLIRAFLATRLSDESRKWGLACQRGRSPSVSELDFSEVKPEPARLAAVVKPPTARMQL